MNSQSSWTAPGARFCLWISETAEENVKSNVDRQLPLEYISTEAEEHLLCQQGCGINYTQEICSGSTYFRREALCAAPEPVLGERPSPRSRQVDLEMLGLAAWHRTSRSIFNVEAVAAPHMHNLSLLLGTAGPESSRASRLQGY